VSAVVSRAVGKGSITYVGAVSQLVPGPAHAVFFFFLPLGSLSSNRAVNGTLGSGEATIWAGATEDDGREHPLPSSLWSE
jgi:hypothetical protein